MKLSALQLDHYFIQSQGFEMDPNFNPEEDIVHSTKSLDVNVIFDTFTQEDDGGNDVQACFLEVQHEAPDDINAPYLFHLRIVGYFSWLPNTKVENKNRVFRVNAPSMLYGMARDMIKTDTSKGPYSPVHLPSVSFLYLADELDEKADGDSITPTE
ncbi:protein-export chaperone SecB [Rubritalea tangerina]|uniref:Protein-export chaperone SecB n=1 Tax=Rubritalea tangerina TaxID=430798 RepID=A0ABW4Z8Z0_9BACT